MIEFGIGTDADAARGSASEFCFPIAD